MKIEKRIALCLCVSDAMTMLNPNTAKDHKVCLETGIKEGWFNLFDVENFYAEADASADFQAMFVSQEGK